MRSPFFISLLGAFVVAGAYWYQSTAAICPAPLSYRLGEIDQSFSITAKEARAAITEAERLWEETAGRDLFIYDETAKFTIDFVFDERQATIDSEITERRELDEQQQTNEQIRESLAKLQQEYSALSAAFAERSQQYEERLISYNNEVQKYNDRGGAPEEVFNELEAKRQSLNTEATALKKRDAELDIMAKEINRLGDKGNRMINEYNQEVQEYNEEFGFRDEFTQGDYQGKNINIYSFTSQNELITVLAHEFGHALGIDHVEGESSVMYYLLEDTSSSPVLSGEDLVAYQAVCGMTESTTQKIRHQIRQIIGIF